MVFREVSVIEIREVLRAWLAGRSERAVAGQVGVDRKTSRRYVMAAGLSREGGEKQLTDELIGQVVSVVRPVRPDEHGAGWAELEARHGEIAAWMAGGVPVVKIGILLGRQGVVVAERTLHRFAAERCGAGGDKVTTPVEPLQQQVGEQQRTEVVESAKVCSSPSAVRCRVAQNPPPCRRSLGRSCPP